MINVSSQIFISKDFLLSSIYVFVRAATSLLESFFGDVKLRLTEYWKSVKFVHV